MRVGCVERMMILLGSSKKINTYSIELVWWKYQEFTKLVQIFRGFTPFSAQHKIKGEEFDNVLAILVNGKCE